MRLRIDLTCGQWRGALSRFTKDGNTVLIAPTNHFALVEPLPPVPEH